MRIPDSLCTTKKFKIVELVILSMQNKMSRFSQAPHFVLMILIDLRKTLLLFITFQDLLLLTGNDNCIE